jgi:hypothetical protein
VAPTEDFNGYVTTIGPVPVYRRVNRS